MNIINYRIYDYFNRIRHKKKYEWTGLVPSPLQHHPVRFLKLCLKLTDILKASRRKYQTVIILNINKLLF